MDALLVASFKGGELQHGVDRVLGLRLVINGDDIIHWNEVASGADGDDVLLLHSDERGSPRSPPVSGAVDATRSVGSPVVAVTGGVSGCCCD